MAKKPAFRPLNPSLPEPETPPREPMQYAGMLIWKDGQPMAVASRQFDGPKTQHSLKALMQEVLNLPYDGHNPAYRGMTKGEAMILALTDRAAAGDLDAVKEILDRLMGKPTQSIQSFQVKGTLEELLDALATNAPNTQPTPIDITPNPTTPEPDPDIDDLFQGIPR